MKRKSSRLSANSEAGLTKGTSNPRHSSTTRSASSNFDAIGNWGGEMSIGGGTDDDGSRDVDDAPLPSPFLPKWPLNVDGSCIHSTLRKTPQMHETLNWIRRTIVFACEVGQTLECEGDDANCDGSRRYICLLCVAVFCRPHADEHMLVPSRRLRGSGHCIFVQLPLGQITCLQCREKRFYIDTDLLSSQEKDIMFLRRGLDLQFGWLPAVSRLVPGLHERYVDELSKNPFLALHGIDNLSNTCCLSVVLQVLTHTPLLREYVLARMHRCSVDGQSDLASDSARCLMCGLTQMLYSMYSLPVGAVFDPTHIFLLVHRLLGEKGILLNGSEQQDPTEILNVILERLHDDASDDAQLVDPSVVYPDYDASTASCDSENKSEPANVIDIICTGHEAYIRRCPHCPDHMSQVVLTHPFRIVSLGLGDNQHPRSGKHQPDRNSQQSRTTLEPGAGGELTLEECLDQYTKEDVLDGCFCDVCSTRQKTQCIRFASLPPILALSLKRYVTTLKHSASSSQTSATFATSASSGLSGGPVKQSPIRRKRMKRSASAVLPGDLTPTKSKHKPQHVVMQKVRRHVRYPMELDFSKYCIVSNSADASSTRSANSSCSDFYKYELYAVVKHLGNSLHAGHYVCWWFYIDDTKVLQSNEDYVLDQEAYMLFYVRKSITYTVERLIQRVDGDVDSVVSRAMHVDQTILSIGESTSSSACGEAAAEPDAGSETGAKITDPEDADSIDGS